MTLYFHNPGEIDIRGATIAGLSAKEGDNPIGFFGTGLKYSIASVLRWGGSIKIYSSQTQYSFGASELEFRGKSFSQVMLHKETGLLDCCYEMQTYLFNKIVSLYEEHVFREPC